MKSTITHSLVLFLGAGLALLLSGCASTRIRQISGEEFANQAEQIGQISSFHWTTYIGRSPQRAYLEFQRPSFLYNIIGKETRTTVYWTELSELPKDIADQLKAGPSLTQTNETERTIGFNVPK